MNLWMDSAARLPDATASTTDFGAVNRVAAGKYPVHRGLEGDRVGLISAGRGYGDSLFFCKNGLGGLADGKQ